MVLNVKAFLEKNGEVKGEIRRFQVPTDSSELYQQLVRKVCEIFSLNYNQFRLHWQDSDGDFVTFSSTSELLEAMKDSPDGVLRLFVKLTGEQVKNTPPSASGGASAGTSSGEKTQEEKVYHPGVVCDGCDGQIYGPRYKCVICPDYDLCNTCELKGIHSEHDKFKITHPYTAGGPGGFMPPHFRRWMHRFMRKCQSENGQAPTGASASTSTSFSSSASSSSNTSGPSASGAQQQGGCPMGGTEEEFLKNIGANISAFLDPFGIDVTYEVQSDGDKKKGGFPSNRSGPSCHGGPVPGMWNWGIFGNGGGCTRMPQGAPTCQRQAAEKPDEKLAEKAAEKPAEKPAEKAAEKPAEKPAQVPGDKGDSEEKSSEVEIPVTMEVETSEPAKDAPDSKEASPTRSHDEEWTMVNEGETVTDEGAGTGNGQHGGLYPSLKVVQSVEMMKAMGFNDDGGWLTRLLASTDGDIAQALDTLKLGAEQAGRLA